RPSPRPARKKYLSSPQRRLGIAGLAGVQPAHPTLPVGDCVDAQLVVEAGVPAGPLEGQANRPARLAGHDVGVTGEQDARLQLLDRETPGGDPGLLPAALPPGEREVLANEGTQPGGEHGTTPLSLERGRSPGRAEQAPVVRITASVSRAQAHRAI